MSKAASDATKLARSRPTAENHTIAMKAHRDASLETENPATIDHHDKMAETHRQKARQITVATARTAVEHHEKMAEVHNDKAK